ncbi:MAG: nitroreductase family protein [Bacillota bacterium]|nr:nitroreductase family protein [Bacillota bacterium]
MSDTTNKIFDIPVSQIIRKRKSVRSYKPVPIDDALKKKLSSYIESLSAPFPSGVRFIIVDSKILMETSDVKLGTYGIIKGASSFIVTATDNEEINLLALGYELEKVILYATSLGLGTCWLGGTFKKSEFAKAIKLTTNEILPIVSPVGQPSENRRIVDSIMRSIAGSNNRLQWEKLFFDGTFSKPLSEIDADIYREPLEMVRLAPSASNKQPWRIVKEKNTIHIYMNHAKGYSKALGFDMQKIDIGIAMCHFELSASEMGIKGIWKKCTPSVVIPEENIEYIISWVV